MQPTARAALPDHGLARRAPHPQPPQLQQSQQKQQQSQSAAGGTAAPSQQRQRQQWEARLASFQRGLDHVMLCSAGDACGSSLCHATKRLMRSYATHDCTNPPGATTSNTTPTPTSATTITTECKVCKLWGYILTKHKARTATRHVAPPHYHSPTLVASSSLLSPPILPPLSCGLAHARASDRGRIGALGSIGGIARDARVTPGWMRSTQLEMSRRRVVVTPESIKAMAKRV